MALNLNLALPARLGATVRRTHELNPRLNAFIQLASESDLEAQHAAHARASSQHPRKRPRRTLEGKTLAVKDMFATTTRFGDSPSTTTCASKMLKDYHSPFEATVVERLRREGALIVGKTNMDEFGMGSANVHSHFGPTLNPAGPRGITATLDADDADQRVAGGSSGGSAAAVAAEMCHVALATDTGGSTRLPASYCGIVGFKPSYGLLSRFGVVAYASSLDTVGIMSKDINLIRSTFDVLDRHDPKDPTSIPEFARARAASTYASLEQRIREGSSPSNERPLRGVKIGVPVDLFPTSLLDPSLLPPIRSGLARLKELGATLVSVRLETAPLGLSSYYVLASAEAASNLARYDGTEYGFRASEDDDSPAIEGRVRTPLYAKTRTLGFGNEVKRRLLLGTYALSAEAFDSYYLQAQRVRKMMQNEIDALFSFDNPLRESPPPAGGPSPRRRERTGGSDQGTGKVDFIVHPTTICPAPLLSSFSPTSSSSSSSSSSVGRSSSYVQDLLSLPASLAGLPAISIPVGRTSSSTTTRSTGGRRGGVERQGGEDDEEGGWPVGLTLASQWGNDRNVLAVANALDASLRSRPPAVVEH
ncbi:hypothetical protein JCM3766R1_003357 [Sporobolomyces carnicolor]